MYKNPRGQCLIINVYNINGAVRRWSELDVKLLSDLFRQLSFNVIVYSDFNGDNLAAEVCVQKEVCQGLNKSSFCFALVEFYENSETIFSNERTCHWSMLCCMFDESW